MGRTPTGQTRDRVYQFVRGRLLAGSPPTLREIQDAFGFLSVGTAREHVEALIEQGQLIREPGRHRGVRLADVHGRRPTAQISIFGRVQAGALSTAVEDIEGTVSVESRFPPEELFALRVRGDSMAPEFLPGDVLIAHRQSMADSGDIVIALVGEDATVKTLRRQDGRIELHAVNPNYRPIVPDPENLQILGKVVELRRAYDRRGGSK